MGQETSPESIESEKLVRNIWIDTPLSQVLRDISMQLDVTISVDPFVGDYLVSLEADGISLEECFRKIIAGDGIVVRKIDERFYLVGSGRPDSPIFEKLADIRRISLKYITTRHLMEILPEGFRMYVFSGERNTEVLIYAPPEKLKRILDVINLIDFPRQQVMLEALIVEVSKKSENELGINWERLGSDTKFSLEDGADLFTATARYTSVSEREFRTLMLTLRMLISKGKANVRSRPLIVTVFELVLNIVSPSSFLNSGGFPL